MRPSSAGPDPIAVIATVEVPVESGIARAYASPDLADAYSTVLPAGTSASPEILARFIFSSPVPWAVGLMKIRDALVAGFGLKTSPRLRGHGAANTAGRVGIFRIYSTTDSEIVLGEDDKHLDFRLSVLRTAQGAPAGGHRVVLSTVVHCHNRWGRLYIFLIAPFHRVIIRSCLRRAIGAGWPQQASGTQAL